MTKRSNWCEFDKEERKYIKKRDKERCVICGNKGALQIMHIFLNRSHGGRGVRENGCLGCVACHNILDNPIGKQNDKSKEYQELCENYLIEKEQLKERFKSRKELIDYLKFDKSKIETPVQIIKIEPKKRCKNCFYLRKRGIRNNTISCFYCVYRKIRLTKNTEACKNYKEKSQSIGNIIK